MNQEFRIMALKKLSGLITDKVKAHINEAKNFTSAGINLNYPGTNIIWPGPNAIHKDGSVNILFFFRGGSADIMNKSATNAIVVTADAGGTGGGKSQEQYGNANFINNAISSIIDQLKQKFSRNDIKLGKFGLAGWSGGYAPIHSILAQSGQLVKPLDYVGVFDGMHHGSKGKPNESAMKTWKDFADKAATNQTQFVVTHTAVDPGSYASSTDTANWLISQLGMNRQSVFEWTGQGKKPDSIANKGNFSIVQLFRKPEPYMVKDPKTGQQRPNIPGTAGYQHIQARNSAPDYLPNWS
jgi:hypothetical protein